MPKPTAPTEWSDAYGLRKVISNGRAGDDGWPHAQRKVADTGLRFIDGTPTDADFEVIGESPEGYITRGPVNATYTMDNLPDTLQAWDKKPTGHGAVNNTEPGPAVRALRKRGENA